MHTTPAHPSSQASDDGTLATLTFRWSHVAEVLPSQIMWVNVPSVSVLHWHPVSVAHVQLDDTTEPNSAGTVTVHFKAYGAWTKVTHWLLLVQARSDNLCDGCSGVCLVSDCSAWLSPGGAKQRAHREKGNQY